MHHKINLRIIALFIFIVLSWSFAWPINKVGLPFASPLWYTAIRLIIGTLTMLTIVLAVRKFSLPKLTDVPLILILGLLQISLFLWLANTGLNYLPPGRSSLLSYTTPLWIMPVAVFFFGEEATPLRWMGFVLAIGGLIILLSPWELDWTNTDTLFGAAMLLLASLSWAISMLCARYMHWSKSPLELIPWQLFAGTLPLIICALLLEPSAHIEWNTTLILSLLYTGVLVTGISYWCGIIINKELPTIVVSIGFLVVPVITIILSAVLMQEAISFMSATAMAFIILGLGCVVL